jgi:hypothetical protein
MTIMKERPTRTSSASLSARRRTHCRPSPARALRGAIVAALLLPMLGCAGGGSSGFDISPSAENDSINQALAGRRCLAGENLTICPSNVISLDVPAPGSMTPGPEDVDVSSNFDSEGVSRCATTAEEICRLSVMVQIAGLMPGAAYQLAARGIDPLSPWIVGGDTSVETDAGPASFTAGVEFPASSASVQVAILVFVDGVGTVAGETPTLTETGATFAFVTAPIAIPR